MKVRNYVKEREGKKRKEKKNERINESGRNKICKRKRERKKERIIKKKDF